MAQSGSHDDFDPVDSAYSVFKRVQVRVNRVYFYFLFNTVRYLFQSLCAGVTNTCRQHPRGLKASSTIVHFDSSAGATLYFL